ncbi:MAG: hypothetical protein PHW10_05165 [Candidatus Peribacteraceae bacterium]|nr:hypothetical protein [Candidatus Peribacteraceae bacterium]
MVPLTTAEEKEEEADETEETDEAEEVEDGLLLLRELLEGVEELMLLWEETEETEEADEAEDGLLLELLKDEMLEWEDAEETDDGLLLLEEDAQGPMLSPWAKWAGNASGEMVMVWGLSGFPGG